MQISIKNCNKKCWLFLRTIKPLKIKSKWICKVLTISTMVTSTSGSKKLYKEQANIMKHNFKNINLHRKKKNNKSKQLHLKINRLIYQKNNQNPNKNQNQNKKFLNRLMFPNFSVWRCSTMPWPNMPTMKDFLLNYLHRNKKLLKWCKMESLMP